jgi:hypothetical protein
MGHRAHVYQDFADLIPALQLEFQRALDILGLDLAARQQDLAQPLVARTGDFAGFGLWMRGRGGGH